jgi:tetratricopeptide (TPR) repeat protein
MYKAWTAAREAFAKGKPEAVTAYIDLAKRYPDVPELTGELGNIYFQQGKMAEAATQYYETAQRLIRRGEPGPAACLIDVMRYLDAEKAKALESQTGVPCPVQRTQRTQRN